jgi:hypothetical protein
MKTKYQQRKEPDYLLYEILSILMQARTKIRNKNVKRVEDQLQVIIDSIVEELKRM